MEGPPVPATVVHQVWWRGCQRAGVPARCTVGVRWSHGGAVGLQKQCSQGGRRGSELAPTSVWSARQEEGKKVSSVSPFVPRETSIKRPALSLHTLKLVSSPPSLTAQALFKLLLLCWVSKPVRLCADPCRADPFCSPRLAPCPAEPDVTGPPSLVQDPSAGDAQCSP